MTPYVVRQGDYLAKIAHAMGFDPEAVWNHPENADLRQRRGNPNLLYPTDILYVPDKKDRTKWLSVRVGSTNKFVAKVPTINLTLKLAHEGKPIANQSCVVHELPALGTLTTGGDGTLTIPANVRLPYVTVELPSIGTRYRLRVGHLDPVSTDSGARQRLANLGFLSRVGGESPPTDDAIRSAIASFQGSRSLPITGAIDGATQSALEDAHAC